MSEKVNVVTYEDYTSFVTKLASKYSMADFNAKLGTMGLGLAGESGEIAKLMRDPVNVIRDKLIDELGDIVWYVTFAAANVVEVSLVSLIRDDIEDLSELDREASLRCLYPQLMAHCGAVADQVKKLLYHGKPYEEATRDKLKVELEEIMTLVVMMTKDVCGAQLQDVIDKNVEKLSARYKTLQFTTEEFMEKERTAQE